MIHITFYELLLIFNKRTESSLCQKKLDRGCAFSSVGPLRKEIFIVR